MKSHFNKLVLYSFVFSTLIFILAFGFASRAYAATGSFTLSPTTAALNVNQETTFTVTINTGGAQSPGADLALTYNPGVVTVVDIVAGTVYDQYVGKAIDNVAGKATISGLATSPTTLFTGTGTFATVRVRGVAGGSSPLTIKFTLGDRNDSNISDNTQPTPQDVLASVTNASITVAGSGGQPTNTPVPGQPTNTPRPPLPTNTPRPPGTGGNQSDDDDRDEPGDDDFDNDGIDNNNDDDDDNDGVNDGNDDDDDNDGVKNDQDDDDDNDGVNDGYDTNEDRRSANRHLRTQGGGRGTGSLIAIILASIGYAAFWIRSVLGSVFK